MLPRGLCLAPQPRDPLTLSLHAFVEGWGGEGERGSEAREGFGNREGKEGGMAKGEGWGGERGRWDGERKGGKIGRGAEGEGVKWKVEGGKGEN